MDSDAQTVYQELKRLAKAGSTTNYSDVGYLIGLDMGSPADRNRIARILDEISREEDSQGHPLLSAIAILRERNIPGEGFFKLARSLSKQDQEDDLVFWLDEVRRVHTHWAKR